MRIKKKMVSIIMAVSLITGCLIGGTLAYLTDITESVTNTFVAGEIGTLDLKETSTESKVDDNYVIVPGVEITKDPTITFTFDTSNAEGINRPAYVFVTVSGDAWTYNNNTNKFSSNAIEDVLAADAMTWTVDSNWTYLLTGESDYVFYKGIDPFTLKEGTFTASIISKDTISVDAEKVTEENIEALATAVSGLTFRGYAIQQQAFENVQKAWAALN